MSSINAEIDAAATAMKSQAALHDSTKTMEGVTLGHLFNKADEHVGVLRYGGVHDATEAQRHIIAAMNYYALVLSLLLGCELSNWKPREAGEG